MKIGRNEKCPCGSGKKYKKCCLGKEQETTENLAVIPQELQETTENKLKDAEFLYKMFNNFRMLTLKRKPHIKEYQKIRKLHSEIVDSMIQYFDGGKFEKKVDPDYKTQDYPEVKREKTVKLMLLESDFNLETKVGAHAFYDMQIYKASPNMNCITEEFIKKSRYRKPEKIEFLHSMLESELGLFEITETDVDEGYAHVKEVFTGRDYIITDIGLSGNKNYDDTYIYTRIITYHDVSFGTGLSFLFNKTDPFIKDFIKRHKKDYSPNGEFVRFTELYNRFSKDPKVKVVANTFK